MRRATAGVVAALFALFAVVSARAEEAAPALRVEAKSASLHAVGIVHGERMSIRLSRLADNAPVHDAVLGVQLRGALHPTVAEADGSYTFESKDLTLPGRAAVEFHIVRGTSAETLSGTLEPPQDAGAPDNGNSARQLGWWVLNFAVCIGFLILWSRRRKAAAQAEAEEESKARDD